MESEIASIMRNSCDILPICTVEMKVTKNQPVIVEAIIAATCCYRTVVSDVETPDESGFWPRRQIESIGNAITRKLSLHCAQEILPACYPGST